MRYRSAANRADSEPPAPAQDGGIGERGEEVRLRHQELGEQVAAGTEPHEAVEQVGVGGEQLDVAGARAGRRQEPLELVERLVGVGALPAGVEERRDEALEGRPQRRRPRNQRPPLDDHSEVLERPLGIHEARGPQRHFGGRQQDENRECNPGYPGAPAPRRGS